MGLITMTTEIIYENTKTDHCLEVQKLPTIQHFSFSNFIWVYRSLEMNKDRYLQRQQ